MKKYIVLSVNDNPDYLFHAPLTCWAWRKLGWEPILFYHSEPGPVSELEVLVFELATNEQFHHVEPIEGYKSETITQVSRLYAASLFKDEEVYLMTSDIDMLPLSDYWQPDQNKLTVYGRDLTDYHYPICYIGAPSSIWRKVMRIGYRNSKSAWSYDFLIKEDLNYILPNPMNTPKEKVWVTDQDLITERINNHGGPDISIDRGTDKRTGYPIGRVDRSHWTLDHKQFIDAHLFHDVHRNEESFKKTLQMLHTVWPEEDFKWWINYTKEFKKLL